MRYIIVDHSKPREHLLIVCELARMTPIKLLDVEIDKPNAVPGFSIFVVNM